MTPADDKPEFAPADFDIETDEGLEAYLGDLHRRRGVPERLRYPETPEAYTRMISQADQGGYVSAEKVLAWVKSWATDPKSPAPTPAPDEE